MAGEHEMDPAEVRRLLDELVRRLEEAGTAARIHVIGGSAMALLFPDDPETRMTQDIDASIQPSEEVRRVVQEMAVEFGLSPTWLNANANPFIPPRAEPASNTLGVVLTHADAHELIAMKLAGSREQDLHDLGVLARHTGITDPQELVDITFRAYGDDSIMLNESPEDYLILAKQALARARKRSQAGKRSPRPKRP
jgi:hypothetical protein